MEDLKAKSLERAAKFVLGFSHTKFLNKFHTNDKKLENYI
jgi:hypothetical protein